MQANPQISGTYALDNKDYLYAAFSKEVIEQWFEGVAKPNFYSGKFPMFDEKNPLVVKGDERSILFGANKINYWVCDYSALRYQLVLSRDDGPIRMIESELSRILLSAEEAEALISALDADTKAREDEIAWYAKNGEQWIKEMAAVFALAGTPCETV
jgi:hypothetical protein